MKPIVSGLYWRKSLWNGFACIPVILRLDGNFLTLKTTDKTEWRVFISDTKFRATAFGTMILTVNHRDYAFVATGAVVSKKFNEEQLAELNDANGRYDVGADAASSIGLGASTIGGVAAPVGVGQATIGYARATAANIGVWEESYRSLGLLSSPSKGQHASRNLTLLVAISFLVGILLLIIVISLPK